MATFIAAFDSECEDCPAPIEKGQEAVMVGPGLAAHAVCPVLTRPQPVCNKCWLVHGKAQEGCE